MTRKKLIAIAAVAALGAMLQTAQASLADLVSNSGSISIGDKTFSDFTYTASGLTTFDPSKIDVSASIDGAGVYYLTWGGKITLSSSGPATANLLLGYTVTANPGQIFMIDQKYTGSAQPFSSSLTVDETVKVGSTVVGNSHLQRGDLSDPFAEVGDNLYINPAQSSLTVLKNIRFGISNPTGGLVTISDVSQSFHQVPEPTTMIAGALLLLPFGASTLRMLRRRTA